jgi:cyclic pyranopterin phosphate synthase
MPTIIPLADARAVSRRDSLDQFVRSAAESPRLAGPIADTRGRPVRDLRISVTDRCNFRCVYCMPKEIYDADHAFLPRAELLTFEEITRLARIFADLGVTKIRLTGGEPLLRRNIERLVEMLAKIGGIDSDAYDQRRAPREESPRARDAGLTRVTVSLDSLDDATFPRDERRRLSRDEGARRHRRRRRPRGSRRSRSTWW